MKNQNYKIMAIIFVLAGILVAPAIAELPENANAALLYYQAFLTYDNQRSGPKDDISPALIIAVGEGRKDFNEKTIKHIKFHRRVTNMLSKAADLPNCDWGYDYCEDSFVMSPIITELRLMGGLLSADVKLLVKEGQYEEALKRSLTIKKMAVHAGSEKHYLSYFSSISLNNTANNFIKDILKDMPLTGQAELLESLKNQLFEIEGRFVPIKAYYEARVERDAAEIQEFISRGGFSNIVMERIKNGDAEFFKKNKTYYKNYTEECLTAFALPYPQALAKLVELKAKLVKDAEQNPDATIASIRAPDFSGPFREHINRINFNNAIHTAIEVYIIQAKTGELPDELPIGDFNKNLFNDKPFEYAKMGDGFTLCCKGNEKTMSCSKENLSCKKQGSIIVYKFQVKK